MLLKLLLVLACAVGAQARSSKGISDKKLEDIETEWMKEESLDEALSELPRSQTAGKEPNQIIREYMDRHHSPPAMMFIEVDYPNCCTQKKTQDVVSKWDAMLLSTGMVVSMYPVGDDTVLVSTTTPRHAHEIFDFVMQQVGVMRPRTHNETQGSSLTIASHLCRLSLNASLFNGMTTASLDPERLMSKRRGKPPAPVPRTRKMRAKTTLQVVRSRERGPRSRRGVGRRKRRTRRAQRMSTSRKCDLT